jgi:hypothetical protein
MILPCLFIETTKNMGRGIFTSKNIKAGTVVEISPVIVMSKDERKILDQTLLHDYIFEWDGEKDTCCMALGYIPIYNHSFSSNCEYEMDFENNLITVKTVSFIKSGEQLYINYNGNWNNKKPLWFEVK